MTEVLNLENVKLARINNKYFNGRFVLTNEYRDFKKLVAMSCRKGQIDPPYTVIMEFRSAADIDSHVKPVLDGLQNGHVLIDDSKVIELIVRKHTIKRGSPGSVIVWVETYRN